MAMTQASTSRSLDMNDITCIMTKNLILDSNIIITLKFHSILPLCFGGKAGISGMFDKK